MRCNNIKQAFTSFPKVFTKIQQRTAHLYIICKITTRGIHEISVCISEKPLQKITPNFS